MPAADILRVKIARDMLFTEVGGVMHMKKSFLTIRIFICHVRKRLRTEFLILCKEKIEKKTLI